MAKVVGGETPKAKGNNPQVTSGQKQQVLFHLPAPIPWANSGKSLVPNFCAYLTNAINISQEVGLHFLSLGCVFTFVLILNVIFFWQLYLIV